MTALEQIARSMEAAAGADEDLADAFFACYLARCPDSNAVMEHMDAHMRGRMMTGIYDLLLVGSEEDQRRYLAFELDNHVAYGAEPHMYAHLFDALLDSVRAACGDAWCGDWEHAWRERLDVLLADAERFHAAL